MEYHLLELMPLSYVNECFLLLHLVKTVRLKLVPMRKFVLATKIRAQKNGKEIFGLVRAEQLVLQPSIP
jgi:hypothetical protein